jgi:hypothetical protein
MRVNETVTEKGDWVCSGLDHAAMELLGLGIRFSKEE